LFLKFILSSTNTNNKIRTLISLQKEIQTERNRNIDTPRYVKLYNKDKLRCKITTFHKDKEIFKETPFENAVFAFSILNTIL
jgi:hypothetical protein